MANIKNFGIKGISADVQFGKAGGSLAYDKELGKFQVKDSGGSLENIEFANVTSGEWQGTEVGVIYGGTGLTSIAADQIIYSDAENSFAASSITAFGRSLIDDADAATARATLGLESVATQASDNVSITGGSIDGVTIGASTAAAADFTNVSFSGTLSDGSISISGFIDDDSMATASNTTLATSESIKAYVDAQLTAEDLDFGGDSGTGAVDLDSQTLTIAGGTNVTTAASGQTLTVNLDDTISLTTVTANLVGDVTGTVSSIANHDTGDLAEGTNLYFTAARVRGNISVTDNGGDGSLSYDSGTGVITYTGPSATEVRAHFSGGTGVTITDGVVAIGQAVGTTDDVTFNNVTVDGSLQSDDITATSITASGNVTITGNLTVQGTQTIVDSTVVEVADATFRVNSDGSSVSAGLEANIGGTIESILFNPSNSRWEFSDDVQTGDNLTVGGTVTFGSLTDGSLTISSILDEDDMTSNSATALATQQSIKAYVDAEVAAGVGGGEFGLTADTGTAETVSTVAGDTITIAGGTNIGTVVSSADTVTINLDDSISLTSVTADLTGNVTGQVSDISNHDTDALAEGATNLYYTDARANSAMDAYLVGGTGITYSSGDLSLDFTEFDTGNVVEGTNLYYTDARANSAMDAYLVGGAGLTYSTGTFAVGAGNGITVNADNVAVDLSVFSTSDLSEGTNLYYTDERVDDRVANLLGTSGNLTFTYDDGAGTLTLSQSLTTDDITEGTNLYYTDARARAAISATGNINYNSSTGEISESLTTDDIDEGTNLYYTDARANSAMDAYLVGGTGVTITSGDISIGQAVGTTDNVQFNNITADGDVTIAGDLTVNGNVTTLNTTNTVVEDVLLGLATGQTSGTNDSGLLIDRGSDANVFIGWDESADRVAFATTTGGADTAGSLSLTDADIQFASAHASANVVVGDSVKASSGDLTLLGATGTDSVDVNALTVAGGAVRIVSILDEDAMGSDSDTALATQQSIKAYVDSQVSSVDDLMLRASASTGVSSFTVGTMPNIAGRTYYGMRVIIKVATAFSGGSIDSLKINDGTNDLVVAAENDLTATGTYIVDLSADQIAGGATVTASYLQADGTTPATPTAGAATVSVEYKFTS